MTTRNRIFIEPYQGHREEKIANGALKPGHILVKDSNDKVGPHATYGGRGRLAVALEDALRGQTTDDAYASGDPVQYVYPQPGDRFQCRLPAAAVAVVKGDILISNGDGTLVKGNFTSNPLYESTAASAAVTTTSSETDFDKTYAIPANALRVGDIIRIRAQVIATATNATDTLTLKLYVGSTVLLATGAVDVANNDIGLIEFEFVVRTIGASGTMVGNGRWSLGVPGTATVRSESLASTTLDTTAAKTIKVSATWSSNNAGNSCRLDQLSVVSVRTEQPLVEVEEAVDNSAGVTEAFCLVRALS